MIVISHVINGFLFLGGRVLVRGSVYLLLHEGLLEKLRLVDFEVVVYRLALLDERLAYLLRQ